MPNAYEEYQTALRQIDELIAYLGSHQSPACALAEEEDAVLIRLADWKTDLRPQHRAAMLEIGRYYQQYIESGGQS
ncbi:MULTISPECIES: hypothetical protein [Neisseria]|uniref:hypothetical protein n=1 Tax=Neisseria TaxID=482 RepID=UPI0006CAE7A5|nr:MULTISPECIES: hypothetical protein [Neisseria]KPN72953.1 hypothetical protein AKG43_10560 [Neisseria sp. 74A18]OSI14239.1 hypothetical protein BV914_10610 [Neisseria dumasiana]